MTLSTVDEDSVTPFVPHRGAMCWLDRIEQVDEQGAIAYARLREDSYFVVNSELPAWAGIEYMAQAVAAWAGHRAHRQGHPVKIGFLLGTRRYEALRPAFPVGSALRIEARRELMGDNGLGMFACRLLIDGEVVAQGNLSVFEPPQGAAFLHSQGQAT